MSTAESKNDEKKVNLRDLDDVACSNVVISRQIKRLIRKFPSMKSIAMDCWVHGGHYTKFEMTHDKFKWFIDDSYTNTKGLKVLTSDNEDLLDEELNKLLVYTHRAMCDNKDGVDLIDTPEDLLAFAETKLQEMLKDTSAN